MPAKKDPMLRFWPKVRKTSGCWLWTAAKTKLGYGVFGLLHSSKKSNVLVYAHRFSWAIVHGTVPRGSDVLHKCDRPGCVRPDHLFLGDAVANAKDMVTKGRHGSRSKPGSVVRGERHGMAKLVPAQVIKIRRMVKVFTHREVAAKFDIDRATVSQIARRKTWRHV